MDELALFAGAGGGLLGGILVGWRTRCAVEIDPYCRQVLLARQRDGFLPVFPIWDDVLTFDGRPWQGHIDIITGGFPCTNISCAGPRDGLTGDGSILFFQMLRIVAEVQPRFVFAENSPELRTKGLGAVVEGFVRLGYDCRWCVLGARHVGANHLRKRLWLLAHSNKPGERVEPIDAEVARTSEDVGMVGTIANSDCLRDEEGKLLIGETTALATVEDGFQDSHRGRGNSDTDGEVVREQSGRRCGKDGGKEAFSRVSDWWSFPRFTGMDDGMPNKMDRVRATGNMQVPGVAALAWKILSDGY